MGSLNNEADAATYGTPYGDGMPCKDSISRKSWIVPHLYR